MTDQTKDEAFALVQTLSVRNVNLMFSMKRTVKVGDEYRGFEASESWTFKHESYDGLPPDAARLVALVHGPSLIKNVVMALHVGGVLPLEDAKEVIERVKRTYGLLAGGPESGAEGDQRGLSGAGRTGDPAGTDAGTGHGVPAGSPAGVPREAEHGDGPDRPGEPGL